MIRLKGIITGVFGVLVGSLVGLLLLLTNNLLYRIDIELLSIPKMSGLSPDVILENYNAVIRFLSPFYFGEFSLPSLAYSENGAFHFLEVKYILIGFYIIGIVCAVGLFFIVKTTKQSQKPTLYKTAGITSLLLPVVLLSSFAINFDRAFVIFHEIFFSNDYWIFDYRIDPIITILPAEFFMHCGIVIAVCLITVSVIFLVKGFKPKKQDR